MREYKYQEIEIGQKESFSCTINEEKMKQFSSISGDENPLHTNLEYAQLKGYKTNVVFGMLSASLLSTLAGMYLPGKFSLIQQVEINFVKPVFVGDVLTIEGVVSEKNDVFQVIWLKVIIRNGEGEKVCRAKMRIGVTE